MSSELALTLTAKASGTPPTMICVVTGFNSKTANVPSVVPSLTSSSRSSDLTTNLAVLPILQVNGVKKV